MCVSRLSSVEIYVSVAHRIAISTAIVLAVATACSRDRDRLKQQYVDAGDRLVADGKHDARSVIAANNLAYMYAETGENLDRTLSLAQVAVEQAPDNPALQDTLGWVYYKRDLPDLAVRAFEQSVAKQPAHALYHFHLRMGYAKSGYFDRARPVTASRVETQT
jgi:tetratricopeptide (TPR) repeat protein